MTALDINLRAMLLLFSSVTFATMVGDVSFFLFIMREILMDLNAGSMVAIKQKFYEQGGCIASDDVSFS